MKLKQFLEILSNYDLECDVEFDVKSVESYVDFARLSDIYSDGETVIFEIR